MHHARRGGATAALILTLGLAAATSATAAPPPSGQRYAQANLVSDIPGVARVTDPNLVNPWGLAAGPGRPLWVADNGTDVSSIYPGAIDGSPPVIAPLVVGIPGGAPTGVVSNASRAFRVADAPAFFVFDSEAGMLTAWNPGLGTQAQTVWTTPGAIYKGLAISGSHLYAADFKGGKIDVFGPDFHPVTLSGNF